MSAVKALDHHAIATQLIAADPTTDNHATLVASDNSLTLEPGQLFRLDC